jgi:hypothetical protein
MATFEKFAEGGQTKESLTFWRTMTCVSRYIFAAEFDFKIHT